MAIEQKYLSFSTMAGDPARINDVQLLYMWHGQAEQAMHTEEHCHDYWQLEIMCAAGGHIRLDGKAQALRRGDVVLIPPQCLHRFDYQAGCAWLTIRYELVWSCAQVARIISERVDPMLKSFRNILSAGFGQLSAETGPSLRAAVSALLLHLHQRPVKQREDPIVQRVYAYLEQRQGCMVDVATLAQELGFSKNYLSSAFKQRSGQSLKECIDNACVAAASSMLMYDDRSIGQIAEALGFNDIYAFSRFYLRVSGERPSAFRQRSRDLAR